ncbi:MAG: threonine--tRNA ligase [Candidatus Nanoarchaeia archaeon]|nr:threonine--tRNA ligase [Candidatus Nanoarchaeia archaeon]
MKVVTIHSDSITYKPLKKALKNVEEVDSKEVTVKECLVALISVEKKDEQDVEAVSKRLAKELTDISTQVKADKIVLYPYAHLSSDLCHPDKALEVLKKTEELLKSDFKVYRAPFGYYKEFTLHCKGHPLSELSRAFTPEDIKDLKEEKDVSKAVVAEKTLKSTWHIIDEKGKLHGLKADKKIEGFDFKKYKKLEKFVKYEIQKVRVAAQEPPHTLLMRQHELVDYEPASDPGNFRYYPNGRLIKSLIENFVTDKVVDYGAMEVETPIMYDYEHPALKSYLNRFPARQYTIQTPNKKTFLRFSACFGQFLMAHDMTISYKDLPLPLYELTRYSFRVEQRGELTGLRRLRTFTMPDCHCLCADMKQAKEQMKVRFELAKSTLNECGLQTSEDLELAIRITKDFYEENKDFVLDLVKAWGKPALIEMWNDRFFYFVMKYELNFVDTLDKAAALATDQIDVENAERYDINYIDNKGKKQKPLILHLSPSGAVERVIYALLEKAAEHQKEKKPAMFPVWLSPTQVRVIPVSTESHLKVVEKIAEELGKNDIRVDIDDRSETIGKRIMKSEQEWVPFTVVIGDKEAKSKKLMVRDRSSGKQKEITTADLIKDIKKLTDGKPFKKLSMNKYLSKRPIFVG